MTHHTAPDEVRDAARFAYIDHEGYGTRAGHNAAADVAYRAGRDSAWADAIRVVESAKVESSSPNGQRALEAHQAALLAGLRIAARLLAPEVRP